MFSYLKSFVFDGEKEVAERVKEMDPNLQIEQKALEMLSKIPKFVISKALTKLVEVCKLNNVTVVTEKHVEILSKPENRTIPADQIKFNF